MSKLIKKIVMILEKCSSFFEEAALIDERLNREKEKRNTLQLYGPKF
jgi:hypothetical protein